MKCTSKTMKYTLKTISPICILSGNILKEKDFRFHGQKIEVLDIDKLIQDDPEKFIGYYQNNNNFEIPYGKYIGYVLDFYGKVRMGKKLHSFIKSAGRVYVPGSSIKGAFILNYLKSKEIAERFISGLKKKKTSREVEDEIFGNSYRSFYRTILFSDTNFVNISELKAACINIFSINRSNNSFVKKPFSLLVEVLPRSLELSGTFKFNYDVFAKLVSEGVVWASRFKGNDPFKQVLKEIRDNVSRRINQEIEFLSKFKINDSLFNFYRDFYKKLKEENSNLKENQVIIQMGNSTGFLSKTLIDLDITLPDFIKKNVNKKGYEIFPKTRRVILVGNEVFPLGWVKIEFSDKCD